MTKANESTPDESRRNQRNAEKMAAMQRLVDEVRASGLSDETMMDIRVRAVSQAGL